MHNIKTEFFYIRFSLANILQCEGKKERKTACDNKKNDKMPDAENYAGELLLKYLRINCERAVYFALSERETLLSNLFQF